MKKSLTRGSALVLAGGALALTGAILPAQAATSAGWRVSAAFSVRGHGILMTSIDAVSARDAWAIGLAAKNSGSASPVTVIKHWTGRSWASVALPARIAKTWQREDGFESQVGASSPSNVWLIGSLEGGYLRLHGTRWSLGKLPGSSVQSGSLVEISSVKVLSRTSAWAFGTRDAVSGIPETSTNKPYAAHFNGRTWTATVMPAGLTGDISGASAVSASSIWALVGNPSGLLAGPGLDSSKSTVLHWTPASGWTVPAQPVLPTGATLTSVLAGQNGHVLVGGSVKNGHKGTTPLAVTWNGTAWSDATLLPDASSARWTLESLAADGRGAWAVAFATNREVTQLWHLSGRTWSLVKPAFGKHASILLQLAAVPGTSSAWAAGALREGNSAAGLIAVAGRTP
jgi:hypothetical protein